MKLKHVCLYAKGWYQKDNIFDDLRKCITADGYLGEFFSDEDICAFVLDHTVRQLSEGGSNGITAQIIADASPKSCWKFGYLHKDADDWARYKQPVKVDEKYNYWKAFLYVCLSRLRFEEIDVLPRPDENVLPLTKMEQ